MLIVKNEDISYTFNIKYDVCSRDLNGLFEQIMQTEIIEGDPERIVLSIELDGKRQDIRYIPKHFLALKKVMQLIDDGNLRIIVPKKILRIEHGPPFLIVNCAPSSRQ